MEKNNENHQIGSSCCHPEFLVTGDARHVNPYGLHNVDIFAGGAPTDPVVGTIVWQANSVGSTIQSLTSIDLTIDGHIYSVGEIGFIDPFDPTRTIIGGTVTGINSIVTLTNDFFITWNTSTLTPVAFTYASANTNGIWGTAFDGGEFSSFSITAMSEPGTLSLLAIGFAGVAWSRRRKLA